jgi:glutamine synthetase
VVNAILLGLARRGLQDGPPLPPEISVDPGTLSDDERAKAGIVFIGGSQAEAMDALERSDVARDILGPGLLEALVAVRRHEVEVAYGAEVPDLVERFRYAWSV